MKNKQNRLIAFLFVIAAIMGGCNLFGNSAGNTAAPPDACTTALAVNCAQFAEAYLKESNTDARDYFGHSVALSGSTLAVGAWYEDSNATGVNGNQANNIARNSGAVYLFTRSGTTWSQQAYLKASNTEANDQFGTSVALSGTTLAVAAQYESSNATGVNGNEADNSAGFSGAVYVRRIAP